MELQTKDYVHFRVGEVIFEGAALANKALPGDIVTFDGKCNLINRKKHLLVGTLELNSKTKYGITSKGYPIYLFVPFDRSYPSFIVGSSHTDCSKPYIGLVEFMSWTDKLPRGNLIRLLGPCDNKDVQEMALLLTYHPYKMSKTMEIELEKTDFIKRMRVPEMTFNIDPEGCMDIDDVISLTDSEIWITIADVDERVSEGSEVDIYASLQGQTVYRNGQAIQPMLPYELSENRCSLQPGVLRPGVSLVVGYTYEQPHRIKSLEWRLSLVLNKKAYTYDNFIKNAASDGIQLDVMRDLAEEILGEKTDDPHKWIEAFMLKYNIEAAAILKKEGEGILRKHLGKDTAKWEMYTKWNKDLAGLASHAALYCSVDDPEPKHIGLGTIYCHASSPIRRYSDLVNQRVLKSVLGNIQVKVNCDTIDWLNKRQKDCKRYERDLFFLENLGGGRLNGIILSEKKVWIESWKRIVSWKSGQVPGTSVVLEYYVNPNIRHWKERIVFRDVSKGCQEQ